MRKGRASGFFGVFLIAIGLFLILNNTGLVDFSFWEYFFVNSGHTGIPVILILLLSIFRPSRRSAASSLATKN